MIRALVWEFGEAFAEEKRKNFVNLPLRQRHNPGGLSTVQVAHGYPDGLRQLKPASS
ncbi:MAG: hypothetical protein WA183_05550 [Chthoniobacterales bacterium]